MKVLIVFHSIHGHIYEMAKAVAEGVKKAGVDVEIKQVKETLSDEIIQKMGATETKNSFSHIEIATTDNLKEADAIIFGTPTRFGNMTAQMRAFLDSTGGLWAKGDLVGKIGSVFTSSATQHGGQESTILSTHITLLHHGMIIAGLPYTFQGQTRIDEITGGSPYGASTITGSDGSRMPSENELEAARFQGEYIANIVKKLNK